MVALIEVPVRLELWKGVEVVVELVLASRVLVPQHVANGVVGVVALGWQILCILLHSLSTVLKNPRLLHLEWLEVRP